MASEALIEQAITFRTMTGLRADEAWVRDVAGDSRHTTAFGVPLLPEEEAELEARPRDFDGISNVLQTYGERYPGEFAGIYIDRPGGTHFVITFTAHLEEHRAALAKLLHPMAAIDLRLATTTIGDLDALMERIGQDDERLAAEGIFVVEIARQEDDGIVSVALSSERVDAPGFIASLYGPTVDAHVIDPTGAFLKPRGTISGRTVDPHGRGIPARVWPTALFAELGRDAIGAAPNADGSFRFGNELAGRWRIDADLEGFEPTAVEIDLAPGGQVTAEIVMVPEP